MSGSNSGATLNLNVDSGPVKNATQGLNDFRTAADGAGRATTQYVQTLQSGTQAEQSFRQATQELTTDMGGMVSQLDVLLARLKDTRQQLLGFANVGQQFSQIRGEVENLGRAYGITSTALEQYYRAGQNVSFTTQTTVSSLQRITEALQNQTVVGQQVRRVMQDYGVEITKFAGMSDGATKALQSFVDKIRSTQDSAQKFRSVSAVLGPVDLDTFGKLSDPDYISIDEKRRRTVSASIDTFQADRSRNADILRRSTSQFNAEYDDLRGKYDLGNRNPWFSWLTGGLSNDQRSGVRQNAGLSAKNGFWDRDTPDDQLQMMRYIDAHPDSLEAQRTRTVSKDDVLQLSDNAPANFLRNTQNRTAGNLQEIFARFGDDRRRQGLGSALYNVLDRSGNAIFDGSFDGSGYKPLDPIKDTREASPLDELLQKQGLVGNLSNIGDYGPALRLRQGELLRSSFNVDQLGNSRNDSTTETRGALDSIYNPRNGFSEGEGAARFRQLLYRYTRGQATALHPEQPLIDEDAASRFVQGQSEGSRGKAQAFFGYMRQLGLNPGAYAQNASAMGYRDIDKLIGGQAANVEGGLTPDQLSGFNGYYAGVQGTYRVTDRNRFVERQRDLRGITAASYLGGGAVEEERVRQQARAAAIGGGRDATNTGTDIMEAMLHLNEERRARIAVSDGDLARQRVSLDATGAALSGVRGDPLAAARASRDQTLRDQFLATKTAGTPDGYGYADFLNARRGGIAQGAVNDALGKSNGAEQELSLQKQILQAVNDRGIASAKAADDQKVNLDFAKQIAEAELDASGQATKAVQERIEATKRWHDELRAVVQEMKNLDTARENFMQAGYLGAAAGIADPQARRRFMQNRDNALDNQRVLGDGSAMPAGGAMGVIGGFLNNLRSMFGGGAVPPTGAAGGASPGPGRLGYTGNPLYDGILYNENRGVVAAGVVGDRLKDGTPTAFGPMQVHQDALDEVNSAWKTNYTTKDLVDQPHIGMWVGQRYADIVSQRNGGNLRRTFAAYNAGDRGASLGRGGAYADSAMGFLANRGGYQNTRGYQLRQASGEALDDAQGGFDALNARDAAAARQAAARRRSALLRSGQTGAASAAGEDYVDPNGNATSQGAQRDIRLADLRISQQASVDESYGQTELAIRNARGLAQGYLTGGSAGGEAVRRRQQAEQEARAAPGLVDVNARTQQLGAAAAGDLAQSMGKQISDASEATEANEKLAAAWGKGTAAAKEMQVALELMPLQRTIEQLKAEGQDVGDLETRYKGLLAAKRGASFSAVDARLGQVTNDLSLRNTMARGAYADSFMSERTQRANAFNRETDYQVQTQYQGASADQVQAFRGQRGQQLDMQQMSDDVGKYAQAWKSAEDAAFSALNGIATRATTARQAARTVTQELANIMLQLVETPVKNWMTDQMGSLFGAATGSGSGGGGGNGLSSSGAPAIGAATLGTSFLGRLLFGQGSGSGDSSSPFDAAGIGGGGSPFDTNMGTLNSGGGGGGGIGGFLSSLFGGGGSASSFDAAGVVPSAAGNAWVGGQQIKMFAAGGIIDRPTKFYSAGGQANIAGEAGNEAILPLRRMPNGNLGVASSGGGGGSGGSGAITINAPITVGSGAADSSGKMDPTALEQLKAQLSETLRQSVVAGITDERRAGGSLYSWN